MGMHQFTQTKNTNRTYIQHGIYPIILVTNNPIEIKMVQFRQIDVKTSKSKGNQMLGFRSCNMLDKEHLHLCRLQLVYQVLYSSFSYPEILHTDVIKKEKKNLFFTKRRVKRINIGRMLHL